MTRYDERDERIARALHELPIPDHGPDFWVALDRRLDAAKEPAAVTAAAARILDDPPVHRLDTSELPTVASLSGERRARRSRRSPVLAVAAAVVLVVAAAGIVTYALGGDDDDGGGSEFADQPTDTAGDSPTTTLSESAGTSFAATSTTLAATGTASGTVVAWLTAIGEGEIEAAAALVGPVSTAYITATMDGVDAYLTEAQEGFGAWPGAPDANYDEIALGPVVPGGAELSIVVVTGSNPGEGRDGPTTDAFPVVNAGDGWKVEPLAYSPDRDTNIPIIQSPPSDRDGQGLGTMDAAAAIEVIVPASGVVVFRIDDDEPFTRDTTGVGANDDPYARFDPAGELSNGSHQLVVVGIGGDGTITAFAGPFTVSGGAGSSSSGDDAVVDGTSTTSTSRRAVDMTTTTTR